MVSYSGRRPPSAWPDVQMEGLGGVLLYHRGPDRVHIHSRTHGQAQHSDRDLGAQAGAGSPSAVVL
jgi:hypothetical protein